MLTDPPTLSVAEAAAATGFTRQAIHRAVKDGRLSRFLIRDAAGHCRLMPEAVGHIRGGLLRQRIDTAPPAPAAPPPAPEPAADEVFSWADVADWGNAGLCCEAFGAPPWPADRWATLAVVLDQSCALAAEQGPCTPEALAALRAEADE
jgi:hypothetical protein